MLLHQGDTICPYRMRSTWRFADGNLAALVYDLSLKVNHLSPHLLKSLLEDRLLLL